ncbi:hypothetical protein KCP75_16555 [Salmonella enterica subsp. enterica]|nr:hypothetical protein KCP75_16555 [Salmonella enterica subsp. enterica]
MLLSPADGANPDARPAARCWPSGTMREYQAVSFGALSNFSSRQNSTAWRASPAWRPSAVCVEGAVRCKLWHPARGTLTRVRVASTTDRPGHGAEYPVR